jgi:hypothetical protein
MIIDLPVFTEELEKLKHKDEKKGKKDEDMEDEELE